MRDSLTIGAIAAGIILGVLVPYVAVRMFAPALEASERAQVRNFRGRTVFYGLGVVWLVWAGCAIIGGVAGGSVRDATTVPILTLAGPLALVAFALGIVDDAYGTGEARGFRGHLRAMARGRLTTGGLKLVGIGAASLVVALIMSQVAPWGETAPATLGIARPVLTALLAGASIALTSNFVNLTDLRPGRALKVYSVLALIGCVSVAFLFGSSAPDVVKRVDLGQQVVDFFVLLAFALGPVFATWRYDLGERGMLGDAGANPMGAVAGMFVVAGLPFWGLVAYFSAVLALNLASERFSFSRVVERYAVLGWLDGLGRLRGVDEARTPEMFGDG